MTPASCSEGLKNSRCYKDFCSDFYYFRKIRRLLLQSYVCASETRCQISLKLTFISESIFVTSLINEHKHMNFGNNGRWTWTFILTWIQTYVFEGACDPEETFSGFHTENETVFTQPLCMKVSERHYSEWFATTSHSWLYFFHHEVIFCDKTTFST